MNRNEKNFKDCIADVTRKVFSSEVRADYIISLVNNMLTIGNYGYGVGPGLQG